MNETILLLVVGSTNYSISMQFITAQQSIAVALVHKPVLAAVPDTNWE
jgi:hypothetical protein